MIFAFAVSEGGSLTFWVPNKGLVPRKNKRLLTTEN